MCIMALHSVHEFSIAFQDIKALHINFIRVVLGQFEHKKLISLHNTNFSLCYGIGEYGFARCNNEMIS